ncbi:MAG: hypothetical protein P8Y05_00230 [Deinococcales bacterium]
MTGPAVEGANSDTVAAPFFGVTTMPLAVSVPNTSRYCAPASSPVAWK